MKTTGYQCIVLGCSAGGLHTLTALFQELPTEYPIPIVIVQHLEPFDSRSHIDILSAACPLPLVEAEEKKPIEGGTVYMAPADYHLLVEADKTFSLSTDEKINFCRPAIDILFESASIVYESKLIGIILTGANSDGAQGAQNIKERGGMVIVQSPEEAEFPAMPSSAINATLVDYVLPVKEIGRRLRELRQVQYLFMEKGADVSAKNPNR